MKTYPPSVNAVISYYKGEPNALARVLGTYFGRAFMLFVGYNYLSDSKDPLKMGLLGSAIIETYLLWYYKTKV